MPGRERGRLAPVLRGLVAAGLLALVLSKLGPAEVVSRLRGLEWAWVGAAGAIALLAVLVSAWKWGLIVQRRDLPSGMPMLLSQYFIGLFFNNVLPGAVGGDVVRAWEHGRVSEDLPASAASVLSERLMASASLGVTAAIGLAFVPRTPRTVLLVAAVLAVDAGLALLFLDRRVCEGLARGMLRGRLEGAGRAVARAAAEVRRTLLDWRLAARVLAWSVAFQACVALVNWALFHALGTPVGVAHCLLYTPMAFTVAMLPVSVSGLGVREAAYAYFFGLSGAPPAAAVACSALFFLVVGAVSLPGAPLWMLARRGGAR